MFELFIINIRKGKFKRSFIKSIIKYCCKSSNILKLLRVIYKYPNLYKKNRFKYNEIVKLILIRYNKYKKVNLIYD